MKILSKSHDGLGSNGDSTSANVAFMDITSACKAHGVEHSLDDRVLRTDFYDPAATKRHNHASSVANATQSSAVDVVENGPGGSSAASRLHG